VLIGIDAVPLTREAGGVRQYFARWFGEILQSPRADEEIVLFHGDNQRDLDEVLPPRWRDHGQEISSGVTRVGEEFDILFSTTPVARLRARGAVSVVTMPDVLEAAYPRHFPLRERWARFSLHAESAEMANRIVTLSRHSRAAIASFYQVPESKIAIVPPRVGAAEVTPSTDPPDLPAEYVLYPANNWPHKNHERLLRALATVRDRHAVRVPCVLTGSASASGYDIAAGIERYRLSDQVRHLGYLEPGPLAAVLAGARAMVFPSRFEGFGMPLIESMHAGVPVACGSDAAIGELVGEAALRFDAGNSEDIAEAIVRIWSDRGLRATLVERGRERAAGFAAIDMGAAIRRCWDDAASDEIPLVGLRRRAAIRARALRMALFPEVAQLGDEA